MNRFWWVFSMRLCIPTCRSGSSSAARCFCAWGYYACTCGAIFGGLRAGSGNEDPIPIRLCAPPPPGFFTSVDGSVDIPDTVLISRVDKKRLTVFSNGAGGTMADVGLLPFARVALEVATQVVPPYRTRFSKHQFTQPQLLAVSVLVVNITLHYRSTERLIV